MNEAPLVTQMILCDEVKVRPGKSKKIDIYGLLFQIRPKTADRPIRLDRLSVFLRLANGRGHGEGRVVFVDYDTGRAFGASRPKHFDFGQNPRTSYGAVFTVLDCVFPHPGYFLVEFRYNDVVLAEQPLLVWE
jgi:hypothetical protein